MPGELSHAAVEVCGEFCGFPQVLSSAISLQGDQLPEVAVLRLWVDAAGKQRGQGSVLWDCCLVMGSQGRIALEDATREKDAQENKPISKNNRGLRNELTC